MPIDTSMYQNSGNFASSVEQGIRIGDLMRGARDRDQFKALVTKNTVTLPDGSVSINKQGVLSDLTKVNPEKALEYEGQIRKAQEDELKMVTQKAEIAKQLAWSMTDERSYQAARQQAQKLGLPNTLPEQYDPGFVQHLQASTLNASEQLAQRWKEREMGMKDRELKIKEKNANNYGKHGGGKAPAGYRFKPDGTLEPIPGGPTAGIKERRESQEKKSAGVVVQDLGRSLNILKDSSISAGPIAGYGSVVPGAPAWQLQKSLESVKANIGFDKLQSMRAASPTGGALGAVNNKEMELLQASAGNLDVNLPKAQLEDNIKRLYNQYNDVIHGPGNGPKRFELSFDAQGNPIGKNSGRTFKTNEIEWAVD